MTILTVYLWGAFLFTMFFYAGAIRGKARNPQIWSVVFGLLWFITVPLVVFQVWKAFRKERNHE